MSSIGKRATYGVGEPGKRRNAMHDAHDPSQGAKGDGDSAGGTNAVWADTTGREWRVDLEPDRIALTSGEDIVEVPRERWPIDVYAAPHGEGVIVRIEGDGNFAGFIVSPDEARPLLTHVGQLATIEAPPSEPAEPEPQRRANKKEEPATDWRKHRMELAWPKVSPLAVWALFLSSIVFIPVIGIISAAITATLLWLHGKRVRRAAAWSHSFTMCRVAFALLVVGSFVNVVASRQMQKNISRSVAGSTAPVMSVPTSSYAGPGSNESGRERYAPNAQPRRAASPGESSIVAQSFFDRDINWGLVVAALFAVLLSLTVHEAAHAISAWWLGDDFARRLGRVTLNPAMHVDPFGTIILPALLFILNLGVFGWAKPVPVRTENTANPRSAHIWISLAGPGSNLILAAISLMLMIGIAGIIGAAAPQAMLGSLSSSDITAPVSAEGFAGAGVVGPLMTILKLSFIVNIFLAFFNLIPIPPLDGSWVVENLFPFSLGPLYAKLRPYSIILFLMLIYSGALFYLLLPAIWVLWAGLDLLALCTPF